MIEQCYSRVLCILQNSGIVKLLLGNTYNLVILLYSDFLLKILLHKLTIRITNKIKIEVQHPKQTFFSYDTLSGVKIVKV